MIGFIHHPSLHRDHLGIEILLSAAEGASLIFCDAAVSKLEMINRDVRAGVIPEAAAVNHLSVQLCFCSGNIHDFCDADGAISATFWGETAGGWPLRVRMCVPDAYEPCAFVVDLELGQTEQNDVYV